MVFKIVSLALAAMIFLTAGIILLALGAASSTNGWSFAHVGIVALPLGALFVFAGIHLRRKARALELERSPRQSSSIFPR